MQAEVPLYRKVLSVQPQNADALHLLGSMGVQIGRVEDGLALIERSLAIVPTSAQYHANYGMALLRICGRLLRKWAAAEGNRAQPADARSRTPTSASC